MTASSSASSLLLLRSASFRIWNESCWGCDESSPAVSQVAAPALKLGAATLSRSGARSRGSDPGRREAPRSPLPPAGAAPGPAAPPAPEARRARIRCASLPRALLSRPLLGSSSEAAAAEAASAASAAPPPATALASLSALAAAVPDASDGSCRWIRSPLPRNSVSSSRSLKFRGRRHSRSTASKEKTLPVGLTATMCEEGVKALPVTGQPNGAGPSPPPPSLWKRSRTKSRSASASPVRGFRPALARRAGTAAVTSNTSPSGEQTGSTHGSQVRRQCVNGNETSAARRAADDDAADDDAA